MYPTLHPPNYSNRWCIIVQKLSMTFPSNTVIRMPRMGLAAEIGRLACARQESKPCIVALKLTQHLETLVKRHVVHAARACACFAQVVISQTPMFFRVTMVATARRRTLRPCELWTQKTKQRTKHSRNFNETARCIHIHTRTNTVVNVVFPSGSCLAVELELTVPLELGRLRVRHNARPWLELLRMERGYPVYHSQTHLDIHQSAAQNAERHPFN